MRKLGGNSLYSDLVAVFFPPGVTSFMVGVMSMTFAHTLMMLTVLQIILSQWIGPSTYLLQTYALITGCVTILLVVHPAFMLTRGRHWAHTFLKHLSGMYAGVFAVALAWMLIDKQRVWWLPALGLTLASLAAWMYRTEGIVRFREHFESIWMLHAAIRRELSP